ncbi:MAG TPA: sigma-70 family RNA polymerase sigma factor [Acidimicrobiales bacterium]|nr:sigma-70 family RNA polymerase sigma factor [Acidimicrobiales bacterium]
MALRADDVDLGRDRSLVEQFQAGDAAAFDDLYRRYFQRLYRFCLKRVGDTHEAEELAQEAFTRAYLNLGKLGGDRRFYPWVTVIAGRLCVDTHRRRARSSPSDDVDPGIVDGGQDAIVNQADIVLLNEAISRLAERHQEVLDLRERQGFSYQRIADYYGVSLGTVEALLWRARKALRREFLTLTNGEVPALGAAPLALTMRFAAWRARVGVWLERNAAPLMAGAAAVATAAVVSYGGAPPASSIAAAPAQARVLSAAASAPTVTQPLSGVAAPAAATAAVDRTVSSAKATAAATVQALSPYDGIGQQIKNAPVHASAGGISIGVNPRPVTLALNDALGKTTTLINTLPKGHS